MKVVPVVVACLVGVVVVGVAAGDATADDLSPPKDLSPSEEHESLDEDSGRGERIFAYYTSTTTTRLTTSTLTALSTCLSTSAGGPACKRRKRRSAAMAAV